MPDFASLPMSAGLRAAAVRLKEALSPASGLRPRPEQIQNALADVRLEGKESSRRHDLYVSLLAGNERVDQTLPEWARSVLDSEGAASAAAARSLAHDAFGISQEAARQLADEAIMEALSSLKGLNPDPGYFSAQQGAREPNSIHPQLSFEQWSALVDLENALLALSASQAVLRRFAPALPAPGVVAESQRAKTIGGER